MNWCLDSSQQSTAQLILKQGPVYVLGAAVVLQGKQISVTFTATLGSSHFFFKGHGEYSVERSTEYGQDGAAVDIRQDLTRRTYQVPGIKHSLI